MKRTNLYFAILSLSLIVFEIFSYISSKQTLMLITGQDLWSTLIAFSFCAVDFAGLPMVQVKKDNPDFVKLLFGAWVLTAIGDTAMTWYAVAAQTSMLTNHVLVQAGIIEARFFVTTLPLGIAVLTWLIQTLLVHSFNQSAEKTFSDDEPAAPTRRPRPYSQTGRI